MNLEIFGLNQRVREAFESAAPTSGQGEAEGPRSDKERASGTEFLLGRATRVERGFAAAQTAGGELNVHIPKSLLRTPDTSPVTGDWLLIDAQRNAVRSVLARGACFVRRAAGKREALQIVAANVDLVFVLMGLDGDYNPRRLERYLALSQDACVPAVVLLTKAGLCADVEARVKALEPIAAGAPIEPIDVLAGIGVDAPFRYLKHGLTAALIGSSGVGKSTLANYLLGADFARTQTVRQRDDRGKHTTTRRELFAREWGIVIDTPGMRELALTADGDAIEGAFPDITELSLGCRFTDCLHESEPDCAVRRAVDAGALAPTRLASFQSLRREIEEREKRVRESERRGPRSTRRR